MQPRQEAWRGLAEEVRKGANGSSSHSLCIVTEFIFLLFAAGFAKHLYGSNYQETLDIISIGMHYPFSIHTSLLGGTL
jgi:hypothetical protein